MTVISDLDGTISNNSHRHHFIEGKIKDWDAFTAACVDDTVHEPIRELLNKFYVTRGVYIWTGRSESVRKETERWLHDNNIKFDQLKMRPIDDYTPDDVLKMQWLDQYFKNGGEKIQFVLEDRDRCVEAYRKEGQMCLQVAAGNF